MKEVFRDRDFTRVALMRSLLEQAEIPVIMRNELLATSGITEIPIPEFFPNVCVMRDEDYPAAWKILKAQLDNEKKLANSPQLICPKCGEENPGTFEICWQCNTSLQKDISSTNE